MGSIWKINPSWTCCNGFDRDFKFDGRDGISQTLLISSFLFYATISSLIVPSIVISLGVALEFRIVDDAIKAFGDYMGLRWVIDDFRTTMGLFTSGLGAQLTWTLPFGLLIMFAVFNRFDPSYEEAARDLGAGPWQTFREAVLPIIAPSLIGVALFGFTLSYDELRVPRRQLVG